MSEKRFVVCKKGNQEYIEDNGCVQLYGFDVICEMLNEQQITINKLKSEMLAKENEQLKSTITHLQEECGARENDYMNLKKQLDKIPPRIKEIWIK